jgi:hypothetical protein
MGKRVKDGSYAPNAFGERKAIQLLKDEKRALKSLLLRARVAGQSHQVLLLEGKIRDINGLIRDLTVTK